MKKRISVLDSTVALIWSYTAPLDREGFYSALAKAGFVKAQLEGLQERVFDGKFFGCYFHRPALWETGVKQLEQDYTILHSTKADGSYQLLTFLPKGSDKGSVLERRQIPVSETAVLGDDMNQLNSNDSALVRPGIGLAFCMGEKAPYSLPAPVLHLPNKGQGHRVQEALTTILNNHPMIRHIVTDNDGTLVALGEKKPSDAVFEKLRVFLEKGESLHIVTGGERHVLLQYEAWLPTLPVTSVNKIHFHLLTGQVSIHAPNFLSNRDRILSGFTQNNNL